jgi:hypothetical protein
MFKNIYKSTTYLDGSNIDLMFNKRNCRMKNKVFYRKDDIVLGIFDNSYCYNVSKYREWKRNGNYFRKNNLSPHILYEIEYNFVEDTSQFVKIIKIKKHWYKNGVLHRNSDKPALIFTCFYEKCNENEIKYWYMNNTKYVTGTDCLNKLPCVSKEWYKNGLRHRDFDKPAFIDSNDHKIWHKIWYKNGLQHRDYDKPAVISLNDTKIWYKNGYLHRTTTTKCGKYLLPAVISNIVEIEYYVNGYKVKKTDVPFYTKFWNFIWNFISKQEFI